MYKVVRTRNEDSFQEARSALIELCHEAIRVGGASDWMLRAVIARLSGHSSHPCTDYNGLLSAYSMITSVIRHETVGDIPKLIQKLEGLLVIEHSIYILGGAYDG